MLDLRKLEYFLVLARVEHFGRAAERLHMTQPGLSQQIKALEHELGVRLVDRTTKPISLTPAGEVLREQGELVLTQVGLCVERVRLAEKKISGLLRVAYTRSGADLNMYKLVDRFRSLYPEVEVSLTSAWTSRNLQMLEAGEVDIAFARSVVDGPTIDTMVVAIEELVVAVPGDHPLVNDEFVTTAQVREYPLVHWPRHQGPDYYDEIKRQIWGGIDQEIVMEQPEAEHMLRQVANGVGIAVLDEHRAEKLCPPGVRVKHFQDPAPTTTLVVAWSRDAAHSSAAQRFISMSRQHVFQPETSNAEPPTA
ncbi:LysR family transcriptional regulator [Pseudarthrobacter sp. CCNWLW207]|uniref:LysR family transcriptional regulator n=1 Tax=Pseudarthrobacter sp. CCNWLW207 TaxID=3127468 RepID=UPI003077619E